VLNPLCVHSTKNHNIRKVKNDKKDAEAIAHLAKYKDVKVSLVPDPQVLSLRMFVREYFALADNLTDCKLRFANELRLLFPGFKDAFANPFSAAALTVLKAILPCKRYRQRIWILWPAPLPMLPKEVRIGPWKN